MIRRKMKYGVVCFLFIFSVFSLHAAEEESDTVELLAYPMKLVVYRKTGNFCVYYADPQKDSVYLPLYDDNFQWTVNIYSVLFQNKIYRLNNAYRNNMIIIEAEDSITLGFQRNSDFIVTQKLSFIDSDQYSVEKVLKVETSVRNISEETVGIGVKAVFDVSLGYERAAPLCTDLRSEISSELRLRPQLCRDRALFAGKEDASCVFFLKHEQMTVPELVYCANRRRLARKEWIPDYESGRVFRRFLFPDVGLSYIWPIKKVPYNGVVTTVNCIGFYDYRRVVHPERVIAGNSYIVPAAENSPDGFWDDDFFISTESALEPAFSVEEAPQEPLEVRSAPPELAPEERPAAQPTNVEEAPKESESKPAFSVEEPPQEPLEVSSVPVELEPEERPAAQPTNAEEAPKEKSVESSVSVPDPPKEPVVVREPDAAEIARRQREEKDAAYVKALLDRIREIEALPASDINSEQIRILTKEADNAIRRMQDY